MKSVFFSPVRFLAVSFTAKRTIVWFAPLILGALAVLVANVLSIDIPITGEDGLLRSSVSLFTVAGGFFVAALTVLITNDHAVLNGYFVGDDKPSLADELEPLTRKRFLSLLFGYLSFASFSIVVACTAASLYADFFLSHKTNIFVILGSNFAGFLFASLSFQLFFLAMLGLHYLTDRLHRSDGRSRFTKSPNRQNSAGGQD